MEYKCTICNKFYKSYKSLWKHNDIFHKHIIATTTTETPPITTETPPTNIIKNKCYDCNIVFSRKDSLMRHINKNICIKKIDNKSEINEIKEIKKKNESLEKQNEEIKKEMLELKKMLQKALKIHPKTLQKINKQLNNNINNGIVNNNNINIVQLGQENLDEILTEKEKLGILNNKCHSLRDLVKLVHISPKYKQFKNIYITNLQNTIAYKYDTKTNNFLAVNKSDLLDDLIDNRISDIDYFHSELEEKVDEQTSEIIKRFIKRMNDGDDNMKDIKKEEIKLLIYNHSKDIRKEIDSQMDEARIKEIDKLLEAPYVEEMEV